MWQTIVNAFTFEENFVRNVRAGTLRPGDRPLRFAIDAIVSAVAAIPAVLVSAPLELVAAVAGRGGELVAFVSRAETNGSGALS
jgi:hypothetical protein